jgi:putative PEP-CTERM system TPR-repeat lipoprotein
MIISRIRFKKAIPTLLVTLLLGACGGDSAESLVASGKDYLVKNDSKAAVIQLKNALQKSPDLAEARFLLGSALYESGDVTAAEVELRKALDLKHPADTVVPVLARAMLAAGHAKKLLDDFGNTQLTSNDAQAALKTSLSAAQAAQGNADKAKQLLAEALVANPEHIPARLAEIRLLVANKEIATAREKIDTLLAKAPGDPNALLMKGAISVIDGDLKAAEGHYQKAIDAKSDFIPAYVASITTAVQSQDIDAASKRLDALKKIAPKNPQTIFLDAQLAYQRKDFKAVRELTQQLLRNFPNNPNTLQLAGAAEYQLRSYLQADTYLTKALQLAPNLPLARRLLLANQLRLGQHAKALEALQPVMGQIDQDSALLSLAGEAFLQSGNASKAAEFFAKASKLEPNNASKRTALAVAHMAQGQTDTAILELEQIAIADKGNTADLALISSHLRSNQFDKAIKAIDALEKKQPNDPATHNLRAQTLLAKRDVPGARASFEKAVALNPTYFPAVSSLAALDLIEKKPDDARKRFETVIAADPKHIDALLALAKLKAANGGTPDEVAALINKAVAANPTEPTPRLALIQHYLQHKDNKKALTAANDAAAALPGKPEILDALGRTQQASGDLNQAIATYGKLANMQPASPAIPLRLAELHMANKNESEATKALKKALEIKPDIVDAQRALIQLSMASKNTGAALDMARTVQKQRPKEAVGYLFESDIHAASKNWPDASKALQNGLRQSSASQLAIKLHGIQLAAGHPDEADKLATTWMKDHPKDAAFRTYQGDLAVAQKRYPDAVAHYQGALTLQPNNALILNNLAWAAGQTKSAKAIEYAEKANKLAPNQPAFMDTLAMLLVDKGETDKAVALFRQAMSIAPQAAAIQLNLAKTLLGAGRKDEARKELDALAKLGDKFPAHAEVSQLMGKL